MDQPPAIAFTAFADAWPRAIETEIGAALCAIGCRDDFDLTFHFPTFSIMCLLRHFWPQKWRQNRIARLFFDMKPDFF